MSRCFPYPPPPPPPPPGYDKKKNNYKDDQEALIESIKSERKKDKEKRKEKKREKKERKEKEKKENNNRENGETEDKVNSHKKKKRHKDDRSNIHHQKDADHPKKIENEIEQLEKSSLTEEHEQPGSIQNLYDSSDSTQNSSKRKKHTPASSDGGIHNIGSTLRIRLPLLKHKALEVPHIIIKEQPSSTFRRSVILSPKQIDVAPRSRTEVLCSTSGRIDIPVQDKAEPASARTRSLGSGSLDIDTQYRYLFENWAPLPIQNECSDFDDQEWLFDTKQQPSRWHEAKRFKASDYASVLGSTSLCPAAYYLSEADMYALPYTVPF